MKKGKRIRPDKTGGKSAQLKRLSWLQATTTNTINFKRIRAGPRDLQEVRRCTV